jgi:predicted nucleotidyltransferase
MNDSTNISRIKAVYDALEELASQFIFIGGATVSLYADRPTSDVRPTDDVDILIELLDYKGYAAIENKLRVKGFINDHQSGVVCRYQVKGITVDVMPTATAILGFSNQWYVEAASKSIQIEIGEGYEIRIFTAPYFLATKLEAFKSRGGNDGRTSTDFEDIVYLLNNRSLIWQEIADTSEKLKYYLQTTLFHLLDNPYFDEWLSVHLEYSEQKRVHYITSHLRAFTGKM